MREAWLYVTENADRFQEALLVHAELSLLALVCGLLICVPLGIICAKYEKVSSVVMNLFNSLRVIPSLAILVIVLPVMGTGFGPAAVALTILACPPILINTFIGFRSIDPAVLESAAGMGMSPGQILRKIELPLAMPLLVAGVRTSAVEVIASATLAAFIGGGGLGTFIINGLGMYQFSLLLVGAVPVAVLAIFAEVVLAGVERLFTKYQRV